MREPSPASVRDQESWHPRPRGSLEGGLACSSLRSPLLSHQEGTPRPRLRMSLVSEPD